MDGIVYFDDLVPTYRFTGGVRISKQNFIKEHVNLIGVLTHGSRKERAREAADQSRELSGVVGGGTHREAVFRRYGLTHGQTVAELSEVSGIPESVLQEVYNRGIGAYTTNPQSVRMKGSFKKGVNAPMSKKLSKEQWAMARVYSFIDGNPKHDTDLREGLMKGSGNTCSGGPGASVHPEQCPEKPPAVLTIVNLGVLLYKRWGRPGDARYNPELFRRDEDYIYTFGRREGIRDFSIGEFIRRGKDEFLSGRHGQPVQEVFYRTRRGWRAVSDTAFSPDVRAWVIRTYIISPHLLYVP
jgi:hypothetical protein